MQNGLMLKISIITTSSFTALLDERSGYQGFFIEETLGDPDLHGT
jgi:hypothetical protein